MVTIVGGGREKLPFSISNGSNQKQTPHPDVASAPTIKVGRHRMLLSTSELSPISHRRICAFVDCMAADGWWFRGEETAYSKGQKGVVDMVVWLRPGEMISMSACLNRQTALSQLSWCRLWFEGSDIVAYR